MNEPSKSVVLWNKGRRSWDLKRVDGVSIKVGPNESIEMDEISGLRKLADYPRDFTLSKSAGPSSEDLRRREQSIKDREKYLDEREAALDAREKELNEKKKPGRKPKEDKPEVVEDEHAEAE